MRAASAWTRTLCLPSTMCGPLCSVPPTGTMIVVLPARDLVAQLGPGQLFEEHDSAPQARQRPATARAPRTKAARQPMQREAWRDLSEPGRHDRRRRGHAVDDATALRLGDGAARTRHAACPSEHERATRPDRAARPPRPGRTFAFALASTPRSCSPRSRCNPTKTRSDSARRSDARPAGPAGGNARAGTRQRRPTRTAHAQRRQPRLPDRLPRRRLHGDRRTRQRRRLHRRPRRRRPRRARRPAAGRRDPQSRRPADRRLSRRPARSRSASCAMALETTAVVRIDAICNEPPPSVA